LSRAGEIASSVTSEVGDGPRARGAFIDVAFERVLGRTPTEAERTLCAAALVRFAGAFTNDGKNVAPAEARSRSAFVHVLLNHNDFVSIR
jgi:hypothetical protein